MTISHPNAIRIGLADYIRVQANTGGVGAVVALQTAGSADIVLLPITTATPMGASVPTGSTITAAPITTTAATLAGTNTVTKGEIRNVGGDVICLFSVGTSGTDLIISSTSITQNDEISISALTYDSAV